MHKSDLFEWILTGIIKLSEYEIKYQPQLSLKWQVKVDFVAKLPKKNTFGLPLSKVMVDTPCRWSI